MLHYTVSALGLLTIWLLWGNLERGIVERCQLCMQDTSLQHKMTSASSSGSLGFIMNFYYV